MLRHGVHLDVRQAHERAHVRPLAVRLRDVRAGDASVASVVVSPDTRPPVKGAWNIQVFHGLGDKNYTGNPVFLQKGRKPRARTALNMVASSLGMPANFTKPPANPGRRPGVYEQANAYGPRLHDLLTDTLSGTQVSKHGHIALNERRKFTPDPDGPILWLPTWDNRRFLGGPNQSSLNAFAHEVALVSRHVPVKVKVHPLTLKFKQDTKALAELAKEPGVEMLDPAIDTYDIINGVRAVLTDTSSLGFEAYCMGVPVGVAQPPKVKMYGLHAELAQRTHVLHAGRPDALSWAEDPQEPHDARWMRDLLYAPGPERNDAFAEEIRARIESRS